MFISLIQPRVLVRTVSHESQIPWILKVWTTRLNQSEFSTGIFFNWNWCGGSSFLCGSIIIRRQVPEFWEKSQSSSFLRLASHRKRDKYTKRSRGKRQSSVCGILQGRWISPSTQKSYFIPIHRAIVWGIYQKLEQDCNFRRMLNLPLPRTVSHP